MSKHVRRTRVRTSLIRLIALAVNDKIIARSKVLKYILIPLFLAVFKLFFDYASICIITRQLYCRVFILPSLPYLATKLNIFDETKVINFLARHDPTEKNN